MSPSPRQKSCQRNPKHGFTLLEMVVVTLLTAILFATVATVLRSVLKVARGQSPEAFVTEQLGTLLRCDLANAREYRLGANRLDLRGPLALERATKQSLLVEAEVSYQLHSTRLGSLLVRMQNLSPNNPPRKSARSVEPVWLGVTRFDLQTSYLDPAGDASGTKGVTADGWKKLPPSYQLQVFGPSRLLIVAESMVGAS